MKKVITKSTTLAVLLISILVLSVSGCGVSMKQRKIEALRQKRAAAQLALSRNEIEEERKVISFGKRDTLTVEDETGKEILIMKAIKDDETGEMVAHDVINAAVITARFRNVAERHGYIDLKFEVIVPQDMQDTKWQLRFYPDMFIMEDSTRLESVYITGENYRRGQLRGYEQYERFLNSIITDTTKFIDLRNLEIFLERNLPEVYYFKNDTSYVTDEEFASYYGVTEKQAVEHYTNWWLYRYNEKKKSRKDFMFHKYVRSPIVTQGIRLDTVLRDNNGDFVYTYTQTIKTRPKLRKVDITLSGDIYQEDKKLYEMEKTAPLTFYISSMSTLLDGTEKYMTKLISRRAEANTACYVDFKQGKSDVDPTLSNNASELARIRGNILEILGNTKFDLDSIVIAASASPEGMLAKNNSLSAQRAASVASYFDKDIKHYRDSVRRSGFTMTVDAKGRETVGHLDIPNIKFLSRSNGENWDMLALLVDQDSTLTQKEKYSFTKHLETSNLDERERNLSKEPYYKYLREVLYPKLRTVRFDFFLHRKGMIQEWAKTTELDTVYMKGVEYLRDREYEKALTYLREYKDYNTAICYVSMDYNASAMAILQDLERTPAVNYMLAVLYARNNDDQKAVQHYLAACRADRSFVFRGNLDPEIYILIQRYGLNKEDENLDDIDY